MVSLVRLGERLRALLFDKPALEPLGLRTERRELDAFINSVRVYPIADAPLRTLVQLRVTVLATQGAALIESPASLQGCVLSQIRRGQTRDGDLAAGDDDPLALEYGAGTDFTIEDPSGRAFVRARDVSLLTRVGARLRMHDQCDDAATLVRFVTGSPDVRRALPARVVYERDETRDAMPAWITGGHLPVQYDERRLDLRQPIRVFCALDEQSGLDAIDAGAGYRSIAHRRVVLPAEEAVYVYVTEDDERDRALDEGAKHRA